jgi:hypothetical protein
MHRLLLNGVAIFQHKASKNENAKITGGCSRMQSAPGIRKNRERRNSLKAA